MFMEKKINQNFDIILLLPPTSPMRLKIDIVRVIKKLVDQDLIQSGSCIRI